MALDVEGLRSGFVVMSMSVVEAGLSPSEFLLVVG